MARNGHSDQGGGRGLPPVTPHSSVSWGENSQRRYTLRAFLEEEASRGQWELATSRGGTGQKYTLKHLGCSPASEVGSQPGAQKPLCPAAQMPPSFQLPSPPPPSPKLRQAAKKAGGEAHPQRWGRPRRGRPHSQDAPQDPCGWGHVPVAQSSPIHTMYCPRPWGPGPKGGLAAPLSCDPAQLEGPHMNQPWSPPWAAGGTNPPFLIVIPNTPSLISFFFPSLLNRSFIHFFQKAPQSQAQGQAQAGLRGGTGLPRLQEPTVSWGR